MKILLTIIAVLALLIGAAGNSMMMMRTNKAAKEMKKVEALMKQYKDSDVKGLNAKMKEEMKGLASSGTYKSLGYLGVLIGMCLVAFLVIMFLKKPKITLITAALALVIGLIAIVMSPGGDYKEGKYSSSPSTRKMFMIVIGIGATGLAAGLGRDRVGKNTLQEATV